MPNRIQPNSPARIDSQFSRGPFPEAAVNDFHKQLEQILQHDVMSLARGQTPIREGDVITPDKQKQLEKATTNLILSLPVGALSPALAEKVELATRGSEYEGKDIAGLPLSKLGDVGEAIAKDFAKGLKDSSPATYYGLASAAAAAVGYTAYSKGSEGLEKLGIKPEAKVKIFGDKLAVKARATFDPHFRNTAVTGSVMSSFEVAPNTKLSGQVDIGRGGVTGGNIAASYSRENLAIAGQADFDRDGFRRATLGATYSQDKFDITGAASVERGGRTTATVEAAYKPKKNVEIGASASHDSFGDSRVGVGVKIKF